MSSATLRRLCFSLLCALSSGCGPATVSADLVSRRLPYPAEGYEQAEEIGGSLPAQRVYSIVHSPREAGRTAIVTCSIDTNPGILVLGFGPVPSRQCDRPHAIEVPCKYTKLDPGQSVTCTLSTAGEYAVTVSRARERWGVIRYNIKCSKALQPQPQPAADPEPATEVPAPSPPRVVSVPGRRSLSANIELSSLAQQDGKPYWDLLLDSCHSLAAGDSGRVMGRGAATFSVAKTEPCKVRVFGLAAQQPLRGRIALQPN